MPEKNSRMENLKDKEKEKSVVSTSTKKASVAPKKNSEPNKASTRGKKATSSKTTKKPIAKGDEEKKTARKTSSTKEKNVEIAILTVPADFAQSIADFAVKSKIKYIWNFSPAVLSVPVGVDVWNENLMGNFLQFSYKISK